MSFYREQHIKATRKLHHCDGCGRAVEVGTPALYVSCLTWESDGIFYGHYHHDCRKAEVALNDLRDFHNGDDWAPLCEIDDEERDWLREEYPEVAARMFGITQGPAS